jgi:uncharacterized protein YutE (UPF0331/DUF86 family)
MKPEMTPERRLAEAQDALAFGDKVPSEGMKTAAYTRAIAYSLAVLAECALDSRREGKT